jgi:hypothetical protein
MVNWIEENKESRDILREYKINAKWGIKESVKRSDRQVGRMWEASGKNLKRTFDKKKG